MTNKLVSIIIVNWNGLEHLVKCFSSLKHQKYKNTEVILVDNASIDGSLDYIKKNFPKTKIIVNKENLGFAEANNIGCKIAKGDYILFLNNDTRVTTNFLIELVKVLESADEIGCVQSKILLMDKPNRLDSIGSFFNQTGFLYHYGAYKKDLQKYNKQINLYSARGACMMFKKIVLENVKVKGEIFDKRYFAYFEETDLCHRVWLYGNRIVFVPKSVIYHKLGATSERLAGEFVQYNSYKNRICSYIKNLSLEKLLVDLPLHLFFCFEVLTLYLLRKKTRIAIAICKSIVWNFQNLKTTLYYRRIVQNRIRRREDNQFLPYISKTAGLKYYFYVFFGDLKNYKE